MDSNRPSAVDSAAVSPPAATSPATTYGKPAISAAASTMMSLPIAISLHCRWPSRLTSCTDSNAGSTRLPPATQDGRASNDTPTKPLNTSA